MLQTMSNGWIDKKWIGLISGSLERFKWQTAETANFRCPICGDSQKSRSKARGHIFKHQNNYFYKCFNCSASMSFGRFLKTQFPSIYDEYKIELLKEGSGPGAFLEASNSINNDADSISGIEVVEPVVSYDKSVDLLPDDHPAKIYCRSRKIPEAGLSRIFYTDNFKDWVVNVLKAEKYKKRNLPEDKRILLPLIDSKGKMFGVQGRAIDNSAKVRYITIKKNDYLPKVFGLDQVDTTKPIFAVEGPIDSLFLPNAIAFCGGDVNIPLKISKEQVYVLLDNEPRSKDTVRRMTVAIEKGYNVMFWDYNSHLKDVNDMVKSGLSVRDILMKVKERSKRGLAAKAELSTWKRCNI